jgi:adenylate cyclase
MATEIERKFLVRGDCWRSLASGLCYRQGYLSTEAGRTVRVRVVGDKGYLTIKGVMKGASRSEYEYAIPWRDANEILATLCEKPLIEKIRYRVPFAGLIWEIDEFLGMNKGLILAEVELESEGQRIDKPDWIERELTGDPRYFNSSLTKNPFKTWKD